VELYLADRRAPGVEPRDAVCRAVRLMRLRTYHEGGPLHPCNIRRARRGLVLCCRRFVDLDEVALGVDESSIPPTLIRDEYRNEVGRWEHVSTKALSGQECVARASTHVHFATLSDCEM